jgi:hypothetical protein
MLKTALSLGLVLAISGAAAAQNSGSKASGNLTGNTSAVVSKGDKRVSFANGTNVAAELQNSLNVQRAKVGDEVILKTKKAIKENGQTVIEKGSMLKGRVTDVQERAKGMAASKIGVLFDTLVQNGQSVPINAMITSVLRTTANASVDDDVFASGSTSSRTSTTTTASNPGLLGSVVNTTTSTVGSVAGTATQTVAPVVGTVGNTVRGTTGVVSNIPGLRVDQSGNASASGGSTLTMNGGNLNLQKGTTFNLSLSESASADTSQRRKTKN